MFSLIKFKKKAPLARVAISMKPPAGSYGGAGLFSGQLQKYLEGIGFEVCFDLKGNIDLILMIDPRMDPMFLHLETGENLQRFGLQDIRQYLSKNPNTVVVHRINECDQRKDTNHMDEILKEANDVADYTVFISDWLREYFLDRWFDSSKRYTTIYNGADPLVFNPLGKNDKSVGKSLRIVTHHWSDNPMKGFDVYEQLDEMISTGSIQNVEFWVIGRWPKDIKWKSAKTFAPCQGRELADLLRQCDIYLTASRWEPCGMHHVEGAQCGLPLMYHLDGGGINEAGALYGIGFKNNLPETIEKVMRDLPELKQKVLECMPSGSRMCQRYADLFISLIAKKKMGLNI